MAIQAKAKMEIGQKEEAMELYKKSVDNTRNGLIWQKVEDECGYSRMDIERQMIREMNGEEEEEPEEEEEMKDENQTGNTD